jgi:hypothetical protein
MALESRLDIRLNKKGGRISNCEIPSRRPPSVLLRKHANFPINKVQFHQTKGLRSAHKSKVIIAQKQFSSNPMDIFLNGFTSP